MDLRVLRYAVALAEARSFYRAAALANISPSALGRAINGLEAELDVVLFDRGKGGVRPTKAGEELVQRARWLLKGSQELKAQMRLLGSGHEGETGFGMGPFLVGAYLPAILASILKRAPGIRVKTRAGSGDALAALLTSGEIDFFICAGTSITRRADLAIEEVQRFSLGVLVREGHPLAQHARIAIDALAPFPMISAAMENASLSYALPTQTHIHCENFNVVSETIIASDAYSIVPDMWFSAVSPFGNQLQFIRCAGLEHLSGSYMIVQPENRSLSTAASIVLKETKRHIFEEHRFTST